MASIRYVNLCCGDPVLSSEDADGNLKLPLVGDPKNPMVSM